MSDTPLFSPELEGLLREAAADPRSVLLRVPRQSPLRSLLARQEPLRPTATGLGALDRHLLAVHRDELAEALLEGCLVRLYSNQAWSSSVHRTRTATEDWVVESPRDWAERTRERALPLSGRSIELSGLDLLQRCIEPAGLDTVSLTQLARSAMRLVPSARARAWVAFEMRLLGRYTDAIRLVDQQLTGHVQPRVAAALLEYRASAHASGGNFESASQDAWRAFTEDGERVSTLVNATHCAIRAENYEAAMRAVIALEAAVHLPTPGLVQQVQQFEAMERATAQASRTTRSIARRLADHVGPLGRRILNAHC